MRPCISITIRGSVCLSIRRSVRRSVTSSLRSLWDTSNAEYSALLITYLICHVSDLFERVRLIFVVLHKVEHGGSQKFEDDADVAAIVEPIQHLHASVLAWIEWREWTWFRLQREIWKKNESMKNKSHTLSTSHTSFLSAIKASNADLWDPSRRSFQGDWSRV